MPKILVFHHYNSSLGAGLSLLHILESIDYKKNQVTVCIPNVVGDLANKINDMGINVIQSDAVISYMHFSGNNMSFLSRMNYKNIKAILNAKDKIKKIIIDINPDIVAVNSMTLFWIGEIAQKCDAKTICFNRETYRKGFLGLRTSYIKKCLGEFFDIVVFLSNFDLRETPVRKAKYIRITDKVDVSKYENLEQERCRIIEQLPQERKLVLYAGGMAKLKGPEVLMKALAKTKDKSICLVFLQYTPMHFDGMSQKIKNAIKILLNKNLQYKIESYIKHHQLSDRVIFKPSTDKVERYFVACDAVVFPCHNPHQARPLFEAGISKRPIIISDFPNYREFIDDSNGWLFSPDNANELAKCLDSVFSQDTTSRVEENYRRVMRENNLSSMPTEIKKVFKLLDGMK